MNRFMRKCVMDRKIVQLLLKNTSSNKIVAELKVSKKELKKLNSKPKIWAILMELICQNTLQSLNIMRNKSFEAHQLTRPFRA